MIDGFIGCDCRRSREVDRVTEVEAVAIGDEAANSSSDDDPIKAPTELLVEVNNQSVPFLQWRRSVINLEGPGLRPPLSLLQSSFLPFPLVDSPRGLGRARLPAAKHFDAIYTVKQPYKIHIDV